jgi:hypothetical protein
MINLPSLMIRFPALSVTANFKGHPMWDGPCQLKRWLFCPLQAKEFRSIVYVHEGKMDKSNWRMRAESEINSTSEILPFLIVNWST